MAGDPPVAEFDDFYIWDRIEERPLPDADGREPGVPGWVPTYDLNLAAAALWDERAARVASEFDFQADGARYDLSARVRQYERQARKFRAQRRPRMTRVEKWPKETDDDAS
jgi:hypothetical protein